MKHLLLTTIAAVLLVGWGESSIHDGASDGNIDAVKKHLAAGVDVNEDDFYLGTPLQVAASRGRKEIVELLIANGANVNKRGFRGSIPLRYSVWQGNKEIAELLIAKGADVKAKDEAGVRPLDMAFYNDEKAKPPTSSSNKAPRRVKN